MPGRTKHAMDCKETNKERIRYRWNKHRKGVQRKESKELQGLSLGFKLGLV